MKARVNANGVRIHKGSTGMSRIIGVLNKGDEIDIEAEYGGWVKLADGGWLNADHTEPIEVSGGASSWNDLEDRPFGEITTMVEIVPETKGQAVDGGQGAGLEEPISFVPVIGREYVVMFNGTEYRCVGKDMNGYGIYVGSSSVAGMDDGGDAPFLIMYIAEINTSFVYVASEFIGTECSISVYELAEVVKKLDPKYAPEPLVLYVV